MSIRIVADSTCDIPEELVKRYNIAIIPTYINIGDESLIDGQDFTREEFFQKLPHYSHHPKTAAPAPGVFAETYDRLLAEGATVIFSFHVSSKLSAFSNSARLGADMSDATVHVIDSLSVSMGLGLLTLFAAESAENGMTSAEILAGIEQRIPKTHMYFAVDILDYLKRGGRISWGQAQLGSLLRIKPILGTKNGEIKPLEKVRTRKKVLPKLVDMTTSYGELETLAVMYAEDDPSRAKELQSQLSSVGDPIFATVGPALGVHTGKGVLAVALITK